MSYSCRMDVTEAQMAATQAAQNLKDATTTRDKTIAAAYRDGTTAVQLAAQTGLTRQQIHRIVAANPAPEMRALRDEVTEELHGVPYGEILPCDAGHIDSVVKSRAEARGISV